MTHGLLTLALVTVSGALALAQTPQPSAAAAQTPAARPRPASPPGTSQTQVGGTWVKDEKGGQQYRDGKWVEITYGRPLLRGRDVFGTGVSYGTTLKAGAPVWRAGANVSTRLLTEAPLTIGGTTVPPGEYSLYIDPKSPTEWTLIVSSWGAKKTGNDLTPGTLWGAYNYTPEKDVVRVPMTVANSQASVDQLTWGFCDVTATSGKMFLAWGTVNAMVPFTLAK